MRLRKTTPLLSHFPEMISVPTGSLNVEFAMKEDS